jgi:hypothetical protein
MFISAILTRSQDGMNRARLILSLLICTDPFSHGSSHLLPMGQHHPVDIVRMMLLSLVIEGNSARANC